MTAQEEDKEKGLYPKYKVFYADGRPVDGFVFVLKPDSDFLARVALRSYARAANRVGFHNLARDIRLWLGNWGLENEEKVSDDIRATLPEVVAEMTAEVPPVPDEYYGDDPLSEEEILGDFRKPDEYPGS